MVRASVWITFCSMPRNTVVDFSLTFRVIPSSTSNSARLSKENTIDFTSTSTLCGVTLSPEAASKPFANECMKSLIDAASIEVCGDKWRTSLALVGAGLPIPRTALGLTPQAALTALDQIGYPALIKPLTGSWGRLIVQIRDRSMAEEVLEYVKALPGPQSHLVYVQEFIAKPGRDIRAIVLGGELLGAVYRIADGIRTNVARGASTQPCQESAEITKLAVAAAAATGTDIAAVDLIEDADGRLLILEVNHRVEFSGFQQAMGDRVDVADRIAGYLIGRAERW